MGGCGREGREGRRGRLWDCPVALETLDDSATETCNVMLDGHKAVGGSGLE